MKKVNCWEFKRCERTPGEKKEEELGVCPVTMEKRLDDVHGGLNAGRACWVVAGSMCGSSIQGTFAQKFHNCHACDFYKVVKNEEFPKFELSASLIRKLM
ncbi:MAG: hypothetical protein M0Z67_17895 [Nitrospiraceae bacterium]|nr:hypothetical protein [Nitrospiraceae bacterium]